MPGQNKRHPVFARYYARASQAMETGGMAGHRRQAQVDDFRFPPTRWSTPTTWHVSGVAVRDP